MSHVFVRVQCSGSDTKSDRLEFSRAVTHPFKNPRGKLLKDAHWIEFHRYCQLVVVYHVKDTLLREEIVNEQRSIRQIR